MVQVDFHLVLSINDADDEHAQSPLPERSTMQNEHEQNEHYKLQKLSRDFEVHCSKDIAKRCILFPKLVLRSLNVWPDENDRRKRTLMIIVTMSVFIMGLAHLAYIVINLAQITKMTTACTTVLVSFECVAKLATMMYYRNPLNRILKTIWKVFWPADMTNPNLQKEIKFRSNYVTAVGVTFLCMAFFSNAQFMMFPLVKNLDQLPLASWYPFNFQSSPQYEMLYIWQWFMNHNVLCDINKQKSKIHWKIIQSSNFGNEKRRSSFELRVLIKCIKQHLILLEICEMIEGIFSHIIFIQFVVSASAMCVSCVALIADPDVWPHMLSYLIAHVFQFFIYCSVGNELTYQSGQIAEAAYDCDWESSRDNDFRRALVMIILRAQKPITLTVAGLMQLSYANFIGTVQLSFSFYVLLDSFV